MSGSACRSAETRAGPSTTCILLLFVCRLHLGATPVFSRYRANYRAEQMDMSRVSACAQPEGDLDTSNIERGLLTQEMRYHLDNFFWNPLRACELLEELSGWIEVSPVALCHLRSRESIDGTGQDHTAYLQEQVQGSRGSWARPVVSEATQFFLHEEAGIAEDSDCYSLSVA